MKQYLEQYIQEQEQNIQNNKKYNPKELEQFKDYSFFYKNSNDFEKQLNKAFNSKFKENANYKKLMKESSWEERLKIYLNAIR